MIISVVEELIIFVWTLFEPLPDGVAVVSRYPVVAMLSRRSESGRHYSL